MSFIAYKVKEFRSKEGFHVRLASDPFHPKVIRVELYFNDYHVRAFAICGYVELYKDLKKVLNTKIAILTNSYGEKRTAL